MFYLCSNIDYIHAKSQNLDIDIQSYFVLTFYRAFSIQLFTRPIKLPFFIRSGDFPTLNFKLN